MFLDNELVKKLQTVLGQDCIAFLPEIILCVAIVGMLVIRVCPGTNRWHLGFEALGLTLLALWVTGNQWAQGVTGSYPIFGGMLAYDNFTLYLRGFLLSFTAFIIFLSMITGIPDQEDSADFYCLLLGATLGMSIMASANHLLMVYIGIEMASVPSYALAGFLKGRRQSSEASLKYVVYGGGASGILLYGISLIAGKFGTAYLPDLAQVMPEVARVGLDPVLLLGTLFILVGISFKLAAVPFHFWCPDVFEGAAAEVAGYLSVASKGAALALLARIVLMLTGAGTVGAPGALTLSLAPIIALLAALTATFGNLAAYPQTNLKRLLAYSTIAHAGYMMMGLATLTAEGASAVLFYLVAYLFMNLGAFAIVAFLRNITGSEDLTSFRGLIYRAPWLVVTFGVCLLSLLGMPPLAGFAAKFQIFGALFDAGRQYSANGNPGLGNIMYGLLLIGGINTVFSAVYYLRVLKVMVLEQPIEAIEGREVTPLAVPPLSAFYAAVMALMLLIVGVAWNPIAEASLNGVNRWRSPSGTTARIIEATSAPSMVGD